MVVGASKQSIEQTAPPNYVTKMDGRSYYIYRVDDYPTWELGDSGSLLHACIDEKKAERAAGYLVTYDADDAVQSAVFFQRGAVDTKMVTLKAPDGVELPAMIYRPKRCGFLRLPALILLHGWLRDGRNDKPIEEDAAVFFAEQGYEVLMPSMRGWGVGVNDCGLTQSADVARAVDWLASQDGVDPRRIGLLGFSFGGQVALLAGALNHRVKAIVSYSGPTDLTTLKQHQDVGHGWAGSKVCEPDLKSRSPIAHASEIKAPVLLVNGDADKIVPVEQASEMEEALREAGGSVQLFVVSGTDHTPSAVMIPTWPSVEGFLAANLGPIMCGPGPIEVKTSAH